ncbi:MAG: ATP-binding protein, partial [Candidatus Sungbacteria bacterium]|nr:ATP-binding protein [Candidatus Sungbacteria bacterium]
SALRRLLEEILPEKKTVKDYEVRHNFQTIGEKTIRINASQIDTVQLIILAMEDITIRKELEQKLAEYTNTLEVKVTERTGELAERVKEVEIARAKEVAVLLSIGDGLLVTDEKGVITLINRTTEELFGIKSEEVVGRVFSTVLVMEDEKGVAIPLENHPISVALTTTTTTTTTTTRGIYYYVRKDKTGLPIAITTTPIILDRKIVGVVEVFRDVTKEKEIDKAKSEFISLASHQLKTPPTAIKLLTERLLGGKVGTLTEKQREYFGDIRSSNQRMIDLVNALLDISRIEVGAFTVQVSEKDASAVVRSILDELKPMIDKKQLRLTITIPEEGAVLMLDEPLFRIVINNLVTNAIYYTPEGGDLRVECAVMDKGHVLGEKILEERCFAISIADTGYGIPHDQQSRVFTKFFRADNAREKHADGTGLGLYIVRSILDHTCGSIWFASRENEGSVFYVTIPMTGMRMHSGEKSPLAGSIGGGIIPTR